MPVVTVLVDTYNHERFIEEALLSVFAQDFPHSQIEILVVDDGSSDRTPEIVRRFDSRVRLIRKANGGQASAFNVGIPESRGRIIAFLDGDDWWAPTKLSRIVEHFEGNPQIGVVGHGIYQVDSVAGRILKTVPPAADDISFSTGAGAACFREMMCFFGTSRLAIRSEIARAVVPIPESIVIEADEFLAIMSIVRSKAALLCDPLTFYRLHEDNLYQMRGDDRQKRERLYLSISSLAEALSTRLTVLDIGSEQMRWLVLPLQLQAQKLKLALVGGMPWETFQAERSERKVNYASRSFAYRLFEFCSLGLTLILPPRRYYQLRHWYSSSGLRRLRSALGDPVPSSRVSTFEGDTHLAGSDPTRRPNKDQREKLQQTALGPEA
jgi:glycosyltransferase involved in cell wall biosynthesis